MCALPSSSHNNSSTHSAAGAHRFTSPRRRSMHQADNHSSNDDLAQELSSQISFNNNLLQQLHDMEQSQQSLQQKLSQKDLQLREYKVENENLKNDYEDLREELFSLEMKLEEQTHIAQQNEDTMLSEKDFRKRLERERDDFQGKYDVLYEEFDNLKVQYDKLRDENQSLLNQVQQYERDYTDLETEYNHMKQNTQRDQSRLDELQSHNEWLKTQHQKDMDMWNQKYDALRDSHDKLQHQYKTEMNHSEETIFDLQSQLQSLDNKLQTAERDAKREIQELEDQLSKENNYYEQYYTSLTDIKHEVHQWASLAQSLQSKLNDAEQRNQSNINSLQLILQKDNVHLDHLYQEIMDIVKEKDQVTHSNVQLEQTLQQMELSLEEEKSKTIMLQEKASKMASREREQQRNFESLERRLRDQHHIELEKVENELRSTKDRFLDLQRDHKELQQHLHSLELQNQSIGERERKYNDKLRITSESMRQLQAQLEKTKDLLKTTQDERLRLSKENESLTQELHQSIHRNASPRRRSSHHFQSPSTRGLLNSTGTTSRAERSSSSATSGAGDRVSTLKSSGNTAVSHSPLTQRSGVMTPGNVRVSSSSTTVLDGESSPVAKLGNGRMRRFGQNNSLNMSSSGGNHGSAAPSNSQRATGATSKNRAPPGAITGFPFSKLAQRGGNGGNHPDIQHSNRTLETKFRSLQSLNQKLKDREE